MTTITKENSHAAKLMIKEILSNIHDDISAFSFQNVSAYCHVLSVLQQFVIKKVHYLDRKERNDAIKINNEIIQQTRKIISKDLNVLLKTEATTLKQQLMQTQKLFGMLHNTEKLDSPTDLYALKRFSLNNQWNGINQSPQTQLLPIVELKESFRK